MATREHEAPAVTGPARIGRRTKDLVKVLRPGDVAVIDHEDLDRVAAESLILASPAAVVNAARSISGRYPNVGPLLLAAAGIPLLDQVGEAVMDDLLEGQPVTVVGDALLHHGSPLVRGTRQDMMSLEAALEDARHTLGPELRRFATNTMEHAARELHAFTGEFEVPEVPVAITGRQVLIVVRGADHREDLAALRQGGYLREVRPVLVGVDGGADALLELGHRPDIIIGDFDSVSEKTLRCGAALVVHAYPGGRAPGAARLDELGLPYVLFEAPGTSEDIAMLLAAEHGAELIVAVGTHSSMVEFLDKGRAGMASTFLVRMRVGPLLVDAKGVSRLYQSRVRKRDLSLLVLSALFTLVVITMVSEPLRLWIRSVWLTVRY